MTEIYWLTRLDTIHQVCEVLIGVFFLIMICYVLFTISGGLRYYSDFSEDIQHKIKRIFKLSCVLIIPALLAKAFLPTKEDALIIYGVGGTIDYIKTNPTAKELPDKCVKALDKWVENINGETKE